MYVCVYIYILYTSYCIYCEKQLNSSCHDKIVEVLHTGKVTLFRLIGKKKKRVHK